MRQFTKSIHFHSIWWNEWLVSRSCSYCHVIISIQFNHTIHSINWNEWGWMDAFPVLHSFVLTAFTEVKLNAWNEIMNECVYCSFNQPSFGHSASFISAYYNPLRAVLISFHSALRCSLLSINYFHFVPYLHFAIRSLSSLHSLRSLHSLNSLATPFGIL